MGDKVTLERGRFNWELGRGYEAPAESPSGPVGLPPGWGEAPYGPSGPPIEPPRFHERAETERVSRPEPSNDSQGDVREVEKMIDEGGPIPAERVNLDERTAVYMGYEFLLSEKAYEAIKAALAEEVLRLLDEERDRVRQSLLAPRLPEAGATRLQDVPPLPGYQEPAYQELPPEEGQVQ